MTATTGHVPESGRTGRRPGDPDTRKAILDAAVELFADRGYAGASVRAIATRAGVDPALVRHYFGNKSTLFVQSVIARTGIIDNVVTELRGDTEGRGERLARAYLGLWEDEAVRPALTALITSVTTSEEARRIMREVIPATVSEALDLSGKAAEPVALAGAQLLGVAMARYVVGIPLLTAPEVDEIASWLGPALDLVLAD